MRKHHKDLHVLDMHPNATDSVYQYLRDVLQFAETGKSDKVYVDAMRRGNTIGNDTEWVFTLHHVNFLWGSLSLIRPLLTDRKMLITDFYINAFLWFASAHSEGHVK